LKKINTERIMINKIVISNHTALKHRIMQLRSERLDQENELKRSIKELYFSISPTEIVKNTFREIFQNDETRQGLLNTGLNIGSDYLIGKILGRGNTVKGYIASIVLGSLLKNNTGKILHSLGKKALEFIKRHRKE